ncbi:MAG: hypothetical protein JXN61_15875 [Sedimentisphaerales bacterium]|nr:hypothetical protein [Sedimentisphaerales bacterium]
MAVRQEVADFLRLFKGAMTLGYCTFKDRKKNRQGLIDLDITPDERTEILMGLAPEDYIAGPKPDDVDDKKEVWEFGKTVNKTEVYMKLRVCQDPKAKTVYHALVWSFHAAEFRMKFPLKGDRQ